jgi:hypothetical protein
MDREHLMNADAPPKEREIPRGLEMVIVTRVREIVDTRRGFNEMNAALKKLAEGAKE